MQLIIYETEASADVSTLGDPIFVRRGAAGLSSNPDTEYEGRNRWTDIYGGCCGCKMVIPIPNVEVIDPRDFGP